ncbi:MAG: AraC family transcriptional regulator [Clostridia bacterium]|nr:AraC family transcriptional regulator [Clostridia bacterium]
MKYFYYAYTEEEKVYDFDADLHIVNCGFEAYGEHYELKRCLPDFYMLIVTSGTLTHTYKNKKYRLKAGDMFLFYPQDHQFTIAEKGENPVWWWVHFTGKKAMSLVQDLGLSAGPISVENQDVILNSYHKIVNEYKHRLPHFKTAALGLLTELLVNVSRGANMPSTHRSLSAVIDQMILSPNISNNECAKLCNLSLTHFIRLFKQTYKITPHKYKQQLLIKQAKELLINTNQTITSISEMLGFADNPLYFNRLFKITTGMTPMQYRKKFKIQ